MNQRRRTNAIGTSLVGALLLALTGCFGPQIRPTSELAAPCHDLPRCARNHVYIFMLNGFDPLNCCHFSSLRGYVIGLGFNKVYSGEMYHAGWFARELRRIKQDDPDARFAVIGFSFGANYAQLMCQLLGEDGVRPDLLLYLGGDTLANTSAGCAGNACRVINITGKGCVMLAGGVWNGEDLTGAENSRLPEVSHSELPTHAHTLEVIAHELMMLAASVPVVMPVAPFPETAPAPRPYMPRTSAKPDIGWDVLKPSPSIDLRY